MRSVPLTWACPLLLTVPPAAEMPPPSTERLPPELTVSWSALTAAVTLTMWPLRTVMVSSEEVGVVTAFIQVAPSTEVSHVEAEFQLPVCLLRYLSPASGATLAPISHARPPAGDQRTFAARTENVTINTKLAAAAAAKATNSLLTL